MFGKTDNAIQVADQVVPRINDGFLVCTLQPDRNVDLRSAKQCSGVKDVRGV
jgi:hypothetical protein